MGEYFVCQNCGNVQHTTEFGECAECGVEALFPIDGVVKDLLAPYIKEMASKYQHEMDDDTAINLAFASVIHCIGVSLPNIVRGYLEKLEKEECATYREATFFIEEAEVSYIGYTNGRTWNGFACPVFSKEVVDQIVMNYNNEAHFLKAWYDEEKDAYSFETRENSPEEVDEFTGFDITVNDEPKHVYAVGAGCWVWEEMRPGFSVSGRECAHPIDNRQTIRVNRGIELAELQFCSECGLVLGEKVIESYL